MCTCMPAKKTLAARIDDPCFREKLELLYARRSNVESLIRSLEQYSRFHAQLDYPAKSSYRGKRKTA